MNKKGSVLIYAMMVGLVVILLGLYLAPSIQEFTNTTMTSLDCNNESISNFIHGTCVAVDLGGFYFIGAIILIGGAFMTMRLVF